jgi:putative FmdB family regulatory protein
MPIYAYKCSSCGFAKDVLQKISDAPLTQCPSCGAEKFQKQVTAAGFQLKGSGWYVTDFKGSSAAPASGGESGDAAAKGSDSAPSSPTTSTPAAASTTPSTASASSDA